VLYRVVVLVAVYVIVGVSTFPFAVELVSGRGITVAVEMTTTIDGADDDGTYWVVVELRVNHVVNRTTDVSGPDVGAAPPVSVAVTGHTVVYRLMTSVVTEPSLAGQLVTVGAQDVTVYTVVLYTVEVV